MSSANAVTENIKFEARVASFYELNEQARKDLLEALSRVFYEQGKKHDFLVWRVQMLTYK
jgi:hypothetical protein